MRRMACLVVAALSFGGCLYGVEDVARTSAIGGAGGAADASDVHAGEWPAAGGTGGAPQDVAETAPDHDGDAPADAAKDAVGDAVGDALDAKDAGSEALDGDAPDASADGSPGVWGSCKDDLGYAGKCFGGNTLLFFQPSSDAAGSNHCWLNDCSLQPGGFCLKSGGDSKCKYLLDTSQVDNCAKWATGKCRDNAAIKAAASPNDCLFKDCTPLGKKCMEDAGPVDCY